MLEKLRALGPGLLYAGAAIGVSHIVQSTRAGAEYGYILLIGIFAAHILKYPFFEIGPRYAASTGKSLVHGYSKIGDWAMWLVLIITFCTMFIIQAAVTVVTAGIASKIFHLPFEPWQTSFGLLLICLLILRLGKYVLLENTMKFIMVILALTTLGAAISSFYSPPVTVGEWTKTFDLADYKDIAFLIAFIGWMPAPLDISIWHSLWSVADQKTGQVLGLKKGLFDFKVGFWGTMVLAVGFLVLGANVIYGTGRELSNKGAEYAADLIDIYTTSIGTWAYYLIAIAAFTTMFSTTLTCLDAMPRTMTALIGKLRGEEKESTQNRLYFYNIITLILGTIIVLSLLIKNMGQMVQLATVISFLAAPVLAWLNMRAESSLPEADRQSKSLRRLAKIGLAFLIVFSLYYLKILLGF